MGDEISTDDIMPAGARMLFYRRSILKISEFTFDVVDPLYHERALAVRETGGHAIVGGWNYGQGSSREHAALAPRYLGLRTVIAKGFARIHWQNLVNFGVLPLQLCDEAYYDGIALGDRLRVTDLRARLKASSCVTVQNRTRGGEFEVKHMLSARQLDVLLAGGLMNWVRGRSTVGKAKS